MKKIAAITSGISMLLFAPFAASALSIADLQAQIQSLLAQIQQLQAQQNFGQSIAPGQSVEPSYGSTAPDSCKVWYDGCNTCTREYAGGPLSCTEVQCIWNAGSRCEAYFDNVGSGTGGVPAFCSYTTRNIGQGASGTIVSALQQFLQGEGYLNTAATGYFGPLTEAAVQRWQAQNGLVSSGNPYTTGWGAVGPRTWSALKQRCAYNPTPTPIPSNGLFQAAPTSGSAPLTVSFTAEGYANTWYDNGQMVAIADRGERYIDFGDGSAALKIVCSNPTASTCRYTTTHTYVNSGTYTAELFTAGYYGMSNDSTYGTKSSVATQIITVGGGTTICPAIYQPVCGRPSGCANTCPAGVYCTMMCRLNDPETYSNRCMLDAAGAEYMYDGQCVSANTNQPPTISGISGPTTLNVNQQGTWSVTASDPENQSLSYQVQWGDEMYYPLRADAAVSSPVNYQTSTFTHTYTRSGAFTVSITVTDAQGKSAQTTTTVTVGGGAIACTMEYAPVCGQKTVCPACTYSNPACLAPCYVQQQTYGNTCQLNADGATLLYGGECAGTY